jgi:hypothetical protein
VANLQIKGIKDELYSEIKKLAAEEHRSISQQVHFLIKEYLAKKHHFCTAKTPAQVLLEIAGSWEDEKSAEKLIADIKSGRKNLKKLQEGL